MRILMRKLTKRINKTRPTSRAMLIWGTRLLPPDRFPRGLVLHFQNFKLPLKRNFRNWVKTLLGNTANPFFAYGKWKVFFQLFEVGWSSPKLYYSHSALKFTGDETRVLSPQRTNFGASQTCKAVNNSRLHMKGRRIDPGVYFNSRIFYVSK